MIGDIFQPTHLIFIFVVALLVLGPKRLPEVGRSLGKGIRDFKGAMSGIEEHAHDAFGMNEPQATPPAPPVELAAPEVDAQPAVSPAVTASAPAVSPVPSVVAAATSVAPSGSGSAEPHPDEYAD